MNNRPEIKKMRECVSDLDMLRSDVAEIKALLFSSSQHKGDLRNITHPATMLEETVSMGQSVFHSQVIPPASSQVNLNSQVPLELQFQFSNHMPAYASAVRISSQPNFRAEGGLGTNGNCGQLPPQSLPTQTSPMLGGPNLYQQIRLGTGGYKMQVPIYQHPVLNQNVGSGGVYPGGMSAPGNHYPGDGPNLYQQIRAGMSEYPSQVPLYQHLAIRTSTNPGCRTMGVGVKRVHMAVQMHSPLVPGLHYGQGGQQVPEYYHPVISQTNPSGDMHNMGETFQSLHYPGVRLFDAQRNQYCGETVFEEKKNDSSEDDAMNREGSEVQEGQSSSADGNTEAHSYYEDETICHSRTDKHDVESNSSDAESNSEFYSTGDDMPQNNHEPEESTCETIGTLHEEVAQGDESTNTDQTNENVYSETGSKHEGAATSSGAASSDSEKDLQQESQSGRQGIEAEEFLVNTAGLKIAPSSPVNTDEIEKHDQVKLISAYAAHGMYSSITFPVILEIGENQVIALVDSGCSNSFMDHEYAVTNGYYLLSMPYKKVIVSKRSKSTFVADHIEYFNHVFSAAGLVTDPKKMEHPAQETEVCNALTYVVLEWGAEVKASYEHDDKVAPIMLDLHTGVDLTGKYKLESGIGKDKGRVYVGSHHNNLRSVLLDAFHTSVLGGHLGVRAPYLHPKKVFYWLKRRRNIEYFVREWPVCQLIKTEHVPLPDLLNHLEIPKMAWPHMPMDFMEDLPNSGEKEVILVVVDPLIKYASFVALSPRYCAASYAIAIVTDRDFIFPSWLFQEIFKLLRVSLRFNTAHQQQMKGQTEQVDQRLEAYLHKLVFQELRKWLNWLTIAEWWGNTPCYIVLKVTSVRAPSGYQFLQLAEMTIPCTVSEEAKVALEEHEGMLKRLKVNLSQAQNGMNKFVNMRRVGQNFKEDDMVYLKLQTNRQNAFGLRVAHVSQLKTHFADHAIPLPGLPMVAADGLIKTERVAVMDMRMIPSKGSAVTPWLSWWMNLAGKDVTWEDACFIQTKRLLISRLEDKSVLKKGEMSGSGVKKISNCPEEELSYGCLESECWRRGKLQKKQRKQD